MEDAADLWVTFIIDTILVDVVFTTVRNSVEVAILLRYTANLWVTFVIDTIFIYIVFANISNAI